MTSPRRALVSTIFVALLIAVVGCASPPPDPTPVEAEPPGPPLVFESCVAQAIELDASAWRDHVRDLRELIVLARSEHEALVTVGMTMRLVTIDRRERRMRWLLEHDPERFAVDGDAQAFRTFEWSADDSASLLEADPTVAELSSRGEELGAQYAATPGLDLFVEWYNAELVGSDGYRRAVGELRTRERGVERMLARCLPYGAEAPAAGDGETEQATDDGGD